MVGNLNISEPHFSQVMRMKNSDRIFNFTGEQHSDQLLAEFTLVSKFCVSSDFEHWSVITGEDTAEVFVLSVVSVEQDDVVFHGKALRRFYPVIPTKVVPLEKADQAYNLSTPVLSVNTHPTSFEGAMISLNRTWPLFEITRVERGLAYLATVVLCLLAAGCSTRGYTPIPALTAPSVATDLALRMRSS